MIKISHTTLETSFISHLVIPENKRTILTGPFGTGKSTFLNKIQSDVSAHSASDLIFIKIQPVNYSIASNDDVFDLIKYDLILEILENYGRYIHLAPHTVPLLLAAQMFLIDKFSSKNFYSTLTSITEQASEFADNFGPAGIFIQIASKLNKPISALKDEFIKYRKQLSENKELNVLKSFVDSQDSQKGHNLMDPVSMIVRDMLAQIKDQINPQSKTVLIVDDMDRLDPEHIFRLCNIFSAHYDPKDDRNKFGFDKVVFVCDLENIKKIYHHRYGPDVDFTGYIDKFYSLEPFQFDNRTFITDSIRNILAQLPINKGEEVGSMRLENRANLIELIAILCEALIKERMLTLRMLSSYPEFSMSNSIVHFPGGMNRYAIEFDFLVLASVLKRFYSGVSELIEKIAKLEKYDGKHSLEQLNSKIDFDSFYRGVAITCFNFLVDHKAQPGNTTSGAKMIYSIDRRVSFHFKGEMDNPSFESIIAVDGQKPFALLSFALERAIELKMVY